MADRLSPVIGLRPQVLPWLVFAPQGWGGGGAGLQKGEHLNWAVSFLVHFFHRRGARIGRCSMPKDTRASPFDNDHESGQGACSSKRLLSTFMIVGKQARFETRSKFKLLRAVGRYPVAQSTLHPFCVHNHRGSPLTVDQLQTGHGLQLVGSGG